jgi:hypothetical protein
MATRFRLTADATAPAVSPALQSYSHSQGTRRKLVTSDASALATQAYTPDAADHLVAGDAQHVQFVSDPMAPGISFTNTQAIKYAVQGLEPQANNNLQVQLFASIVSQDGTTVRRVLRSKVLEGVELGTALAARTHSTTQDGATYVTVAGDRLVVEFSVSGTPVAAGGVQGHNASLRWGGNGAGGDLLENDTETGTTRNPWIEFVPNVVFYTEGQASKTLDPVGLSATGKTEIEGEAAQALDGTSLTAAGQAEVEGESAQTVGGLGLGATGEVVTPSGGVEGQLAQTVQDAGVSATGTAEVRGQAAGTLGTEGLAAAGEVDVQGQAAGALGAEGLSAAGEVDIRGQAAATAGNVVPIAAGEVDGQGQAAPAIGGVTPTVAGQVAVQGQAAPGAGTEGLSATGIVGDVPVTGQLAQTLGGVTPAAAGQVAVQGQVSKQVAEIGLAGEADVEIRGTGGATVGQAGLTAAGQATIEGQFAKVVENVGLSAQGTAQTLQGITGTLNVQIGEVVSAARVHTCCDASLTNLSQMTAPIQSIAVSDASQTVYALQASSEG